MPERLPAPLRVDIHERQSGIPEALGERGLEIAVLVLPAGDYALPGNALVERKSVRDLHGAIVKGTFWTQVGKLRRSFSYPFLLVEGSDVDDGPLSPKAIRGVILATIEQGIRLIRTNDRDDSILWLERLAIRAAGRAKHDRPRYAQAPKPLPGAAAAEAMLAAVPGISTVNARALLSRFGSVAAVLAAGREAWLSVPGIGPTRADAIERTLTTRP